MCKGEKGKIIEKCKNNITCIFNVMIIFNVIHVIIINSETKDNTIYKKYRCHVRTSMDVAAAEKPDKSEL